MMVGETVEQLLLGASLLMAVVTGVLLSVLVIIEDTRLPTTEHPEDG